MDRCEKGLKCFAVAQQADWKLADELHDQFASLVDEIAIGDPGAIPFDHGEFGIVQSADFPFSKDVAEIKYVAQAVGQQPLHRIFGRCVKIADFLICHPGVHDLDIGIERGALNERAAIDFEYIAAFEKRAHLFKHARPIAENRCFFDEFHLR